jgi:hypothetical protein
MPQGRAILKRLTIMSKEFAIVNNSPSSSNHLSTGARFASSAIVDARSESTRPRVPPLAFSVPSGLR